MTQGGRLRLAANIHSPARKGFIKAGVQIDYFETPACNVDIVARDGKAAHLSPDRPKTAKGFWWN